MSETKTGDGARLDFADVLKKIEEMKKSGSVDLSTEEDLSIAVMNLVSLEEHFFFTASKTSKEKYFDLMQEVRSVRKDMLGRLVSRHEGETWCISKHLLGATMRLIEVGTKLHSDGKTAEARDVFSRAEKLYALFWGLRLKLISTENLASVSAAEQPWTLKDIMNRMVNCCDE